MCQQKSLDCRHREIQLQFFSLSQEAVLDRAMSRDGEIYPAPLNHILQSTDTLL